MLQLEEIVRQNAFHHFAVAEFQADPEPRHFGAGKENMPLRAAGVLKLADERDGLDLRVGDLRDVAVLREQFHALGLKKPGRIDVSGERFPFETPDYNLFCGGGGQTFLKCDNYVSNI